MIYYFILGLIYTVILWIIKKDRIVRFTNQPVFRYHPVTCLLSMAVTVTIVVCLWPLSFVLIVIDAVKCNTKGDSR